MSNTRVKKKGEKTVVYMDGQQLQGSGSNIMISCGPGASQSRGTVYQMPNSLYDGGTAGIVSCMGSGGSSCRTTVSLENMNKEPQILRVVPRGTTILVEEVKPPPKAQDSGSAAGGRSKYGASRKGSPTIQVLQECESSVDYYPPCTPPASEPGPAEHCIECLEELIQRRRSVRRYDRDGQTEMRVTTRFVDEDQIPRSRGGGCCPTCGNPMPRRARD